MKLKLREFLQSGVDPFITERNSKNCSKNDKTRDNKLCYAEECNRDSTTKPTQYISQTRTKHHLKIDNSQYFLPFISERSSTGKTLSSQLSKNTSPSYSSKPIMSSFNNQQKQPSNRNSILKKLKINTMDSTINNITNLECNSTSLTDSIISKSNRNNQNSRYQQSNENSSPQFCSLSTSYSKENLGSFSLSNQPLLNQTNSEGSFMEQSNKSQLLQPFFLSPKVLKTPKQQQQLLVEEQKDGLITQKLIHKTNINYNMFATQLSQSSEEDNNSYQSVSPSLNPIDLAGPIITHDNFKHYKLNQPPPATEFLQRLAEEKKQAENQLLSDDNTKTLKKDSYLSSFRSSSRSRQQQFCQSPRFNYKNTPKQSTSTPPPLGTYTLNYKLVSKTVPICKIQGLKTKDSQNHQDQDNLKDKTTPDRQILPRGIIQNQESEEGFEKMYFKIIKQIKADVQQQIKTSGGKQLHPTNSLGMPEKYINAEEIMKIDTEFRSKVKKQREKLNKIKMFLVFFQNK